MRDLDELALALPGVTKELSDEGRPSYLANYLRIQQAGLRDVVARLDARVAGMHSRREAAEMTRSVTC